MRSLVLEGWSFIPGPTAISEPPGSSLNLFDIAYYEPGSVAEAILAYPGSSLLHPAEPTWWEWQAVWTSGDHFISLGITLFEDEPPTWGGSVIETCCDPEDILKLWESLRRKFPAIWLHNQDCEVHSPGSFRRSLGI